jgi:hypothetical protein
MSKPIIKVKLFAPPFYWQLIEDGRLEESFGDDLGCGPGGLGDLMVPDVILGANMFEACKIHDVMYRSGETLADKESADRTYLNNMIRIIAASPGSWGLRKARLWFAHKYYMAVHKYGGPAYWDGKNLPEEEREIET